MAAGQMFDQGEPKQEIDLLRSPVRKEPCVPQVVIASANPNLKGLRIYDRFVITPARNYRKPMVQGLLEQRRDRDVHTILSALKECTRQLDRLRERLNALNLRTCSRQLSFNRRGIRDGLGGGIKLGARASSFGQRECVLSTQLSCQLF